MLLSQVNETDGRVGSMRQRSGIDFCDTGCHESICHTGEGFCPLDFCSLACDDESKEIKCSNNNRRGDVNAGRDI